MKQFLFSLSILFTLNSCSDSTTDSGNSETDLPEQAVQPTNSTADAQTPVLFVQWQYPASVNGMQALEKRQSLEDAIEAALQSKGQGKWFAGDLGTGGANMLYEVMSPEQALPIIVDVLKREGIEKETVVAQRIYNGAKDWTYKVVYPKNYKGQFNDL